MSETQALHFKLGDRFGQTLTDIAQEHIQYNYNLQKGIDVIEKGLVGIPRDMVLDIIIGDKIIMVENEECFVTKRHEGHDVLGYKRFNPSKWTDKEIEKLVKSGDGLAETMDLWINDLKYKRNGHFNIDFESSALMKYIFNGDDSEMLMEIEDELEPYRQLQLIVDAYINKANTALKCIADLYKLSKTEECKGKVEWVIDIPPTLQVVLNIKSQIKQLVNITREKDSVVKPQEPNVQDFYDGNFDGDNLLDSYLESQRKIDKVEEEGIKPSDVRENLNAYWLAPNGDAYGLNGDIANLLHNQIADMLVGANIIDCGNTNPDSYMLEEGWLKLHNGEVLGDHVYHEILITEEQKATLIQYCLGQPEYILYMNHRIMKQFISKARLEMTELGALTDMLDIGMKKEGSEKKQSIRNIRKIISNNLKNTT